MHHCRSLGGLAFDVVVASHCLVPAAVLVVAHQLYYAVHGLGKRFIGLPAVVPHLVYVFGHVLKSLVPRSGGEAYFEAAAYNLAGFHLAVGHAEHGREGYGLHMVVVVLDCETNGGVVYAAPVERREGVVGAHESRHAASGSLSLDHCHGGGHHGRQKHVWLRLYAAVLVHGRKLHVCDRGGQCCVCGHYTEAVAAVFGGCEVELEGGAAGVFCKSPYASYCVVAGRDIFHLYAVAVYVACFDRHSLAYRAAQVRIGRNRVAACPRGVVRLVAGAFMLLGAGDYEDLVVFHRADEIEPFAVGLGRHGASQCAAAFTCLYVLQAQFAARYFGHSLGLGVDWERRSDEYALLCRNGARGE